MSLDINEECISIFINVFYSDWNSWFVYFKYKQWNKNQNL